MSVIQGLRKDPVEVEMTPTSLAQLGALIGDPIRAAILLCLGDGTTRPAGELAALVGASPQAVSAHLAQLIAGGLLKVEKQGRHRFFRISSGEVAEIIENLSNWASLPPARQRHDHALCKARLCYDHLAGRLGVALLECLTERKLLALGADGLALSETGRNWLQHQIGKPLSGGNGRRPQIKLCLDWTERRNHLGGHLGALLAELMLERGYVVPGSKRRLLLVTPAGARFFLVELGMVVDR